jgi:hypothetical protein
MRTRLFYILLFYVLSASAQEFGTHWIAYPAVDSTSQVWFRQTYISNKRPVFAKITIATTGYCDLYVNEFNVSRDFLVPYRESKNDQPVGITYDVTRFLRTDSNTIAVWYSPSYPHINERQISVCYYGKDWKGKNFAHFSDENWLCHLADRSLSANGTESQDGCFYPFYWKGNSFDPACWQSAVNVSDNDSPHFVDYSTSYPAEKVNKIMVPKYFDVDGDSVYYEFGRGFYGTLRVTLRDCKIGEKIMIDGSEYTCNGKIDEQFYQKISTYHGNRIRIYGDEKFRRAQIQKIEAIQTIPDYHTDFLR